MAVCATKGRQEPLAISFCLKNKEANLQQIKCKGIVREEGAGSYRGNGVESSPDLCVLSRSESHE